MTDTPSRMFGLVCVLILIWVGVYWLYEPRAAPPPITRDAGRPMLPAGSLSESPPDSLGATPDVVEPKPPEPQRSRQKVEPKPPTPDSPSPALPNGPRTRVVAPKFREYVVQRGDTSFEKVAERVFNDRGMWEVIAKANPFVTSDRLKPGRTVLKIPLDPANIQGKVVTEGGAGGGGGGGTPVDSTPTPATPGETTYVIQADDTLWAIAKKVYGRGSAWRTIYDANRDAIKDPDRPKAGTVLKVPPKPKD